MEKVEIIRLSSAPPQQGQECGKEENLA